MDAVPTGSMRGSLSSLKSTSGHERDEKEPPRRPSIVWERSEDDVRFLSFWLIYIDIEFSLFLNSYKSLNLLMRLKNNW